MVYTKIIVENSPALRGTVKISGAKNSVLPIIAASLLSYGEVFIDDVPELKDVNVMIELIKFLGAHCTFKNGKLKINVDIKDVEAPYELVKKMRASFLVMGPILAKLGHAKISLPGGCAIGTRPIDLHLKGFQTLGAQIDIGHGYVEARAKRLVGKKVYLDFPSVGATENIMMAAVFADGITTIENAAEEPEVVDLANFLNKMGANIKGAGTDTIRIEGVKELKGTEHTVIPDRIEAGTYMVAAAMTGGDVLIENVIVDHIKPIIAKLTECGIDVFEEGTGVRVKGKRNYKAVDVKTLPYPGFPTDMQAQMMAMMAGAKGTSVIIETVFENRFMHVDELKRMGADIKIEGRTAVVTGIDHLSGAEVKATDLRAGAALILAGLIAEGKTIINDVHHIDRGYVNIEEKLKNLGAIIYRVD
ncbi:UDP-N-acetylglucosamine 1-carboxyvinyltransferase [Thermoanaerobacterium thermosaccharolyticum]|uniref:UDP-N-acetylglucosamine 1-carboxyvinyltransferase n=1 Tax=Thermoanaerobacterium thermosaccharolyticum (strain ATCC 7956 / DSM 571 / NCIMB 9385 / NCA 3814 / NCTC 13789 / WDCM 00135 / 2032) TaxID=580327 RepID=D9TTU2_THETC|nr:UDP-N-acetylglucosamine 1-carboxyvinyltransferase [Thermoanaerobacterium thermosaccharolyticum]ADL69980.1 UDP-N-acetylglucosamine 1-carboxyvinyltransferase [Thermoanaerobacterium thermosaccharolyticum DSM 571]KAA5807508.1 UDP-N-acetylglucosamine 1-carboxyvinyltransferase [Thermoanaerobacterium thermosaccharolyticum]